MSTALDHARSQMQALLDDALHRRACADAEVRALGAALVALDRAGHDARPLPGPAVTWVPVAVNEATNRMAAEADAVWAAKLNGTPLAAEVAEQIRMAAAVLGPVPSPAHPQSSGDAPPAPTRASTPPDARTEGGAPEPRNRNKGETKHDYAEVARIARQALADGAPVSRTVSEQMGVSPDMGRYLVRAARKAGHDIPALPMGPKPAKAKRDPVPDVIATQAARQAETSDPLPMSLAAELEAEGDDLDEADPPAYPGHVRFVTATLTERRDGTLTPGPTPAAPESTPAPGQACHICDDCGWATERKGLLSIHVHSHHHRPLTAAESRFRIYEGADA